MTGRDLIINAPPQHGKTLLIRCAITRFLTWSAKNRLGRSVILAGYAAEYIKKRGKQIRDDLKKIAKRTGIGPKHGSVSSSWIEFEDGTNITIAGLRGSITGNPAHLLVVDDPYSRREEALSPATNNRVINIFFDTLDTRVQKGGQRIIISTRWALNDLCGTLIKKDPRFKVLRFPALAEPGDILGRKVDEPLDPRRYDFDTLNARRKVTPNSIWECVYQQNPLPDSSQMWPEELLRRAELEDGWVVFGCKKVQWEALEFFITVDPALGLKDSDYTALAVWGWDGQDLVLVHTEVEVCEWYQTIGRIKQLKQDNPRIERAYIESTQFQLEAVRRAEDALPDLDVRELKADKDKQARLRAAQPMAEIGAVWHLNNMVWTSELEETLLSYPQVDNDDIVDAWAYGILAAGSDYMRAEWAPKITSRVRRGRRTFV